MNKGMTNLIAPIKLYGCVTPCETFSFIYFRVRTYRTRRTNRECCMVHLLCRLQSWC